MLDVIWHPQRQRRLVALKVPEAQARCHKVNPPPKKKVVFRTLEIQGESRLLLVVELNFCTMEYCFSGTYISTALLQFTLFLTSSIHFHF